MNIYNYKGFFSLVLLALVDTEDRFLSVDVGSSGSSSHAQIFNQSKLRKKIEDGTLARFAFLAARRRICLDAMTCETLQQKITHKGREDSKLQDLQRQKGSRECVWNISEHQNLMFCGNIVSLLIINQLSYIKPKNRYQIFTCSPNTMGNYSKRFYDSLQRSITE